MNFLVDFSTIVGELSCGFFGVFEEFSCGLSSYLSAFLVNFLMDFGHLAGELSCGFSSGLSDEIRGRFTRKFINDFFVDFSPVFQRFLK